MNIKTYPYSRSPIDFDPDEGMTRQANKDECDINKIMEKYQKTGVLNHISTYGAVYGDFLAIDFQEAQETILAGQNMFNDLPSSARKYFNNDPAEFMEFVHDPDNVDKLRELGLLIAQEAPETPDPVPTPSEPEKNAKDAD